jgi:DNA polymerase III epsilon subunit-like protein
MTNDIVAIDFETTGLSPHRGHRVIEIGAVRIVNGSFKEEFQTMIDCGASIPMAAQQIHGITPVMLRGQPKPETAFAAFRDFIGRSPLAAHNARFDLSFLRRYNRIEELRWKPSWSFSRTGKSGELCKTMNGGFRLLMSVRHLPTAPTQVRIGENSSKG